MVMGSLSVRLPLGARRYDLERDIRRVGQVDEVIDLGAHGLRVNPPGAEG